MSSQNLTFLALNTIKFRKEILTNKIQLAIIFQTFCYTVFKFGLSAFSCEGDTAENGKNQMKTMCNI